MPNRNERHRVKRIAVPPQTLSDGESRRVNVVPVSGVHVGFRGFSVTRLENDGPSYNQGFNSQGHKNAVVLFHRELKTVATDGAREIPGHLKHSGKTKDLRAGFWF